MTDASLFEKNRLGYFEEPELRQLVDFLFPAHNITFASFFMSEITYKCGTCNKRIKKAVHWTKLIQMPKICRCAKLSNIFSVNGAMEEAPLMAHINKIFTLRSFDAIISLTQDQVRAFFYMQFPSLQNKVTLTMMTPRLYADDLVVKTCSQCGVHISTTLFALYLERNYVCLCAQLEGNTDKNVNALINLSYAESTHWRRDSLHRRVLSLLRGTSAPPYLDIEDAKIPCAQNAAPFVKRARARVPDKIFTFGEIRSGVPTCIIHGEPKKPSADPAQLPHCAECADPLELFTSEPQNTILVMRSIYGFDLPRDVSSFDFECAKHGTQQSSIAHLFHGRPCLHCPALPRDEYSSRAREVLRTLTRIRAVPWTLSYPFFGFLTLQTYTCEEGHVRHINRGFGILNERFCVLCVRRISSNVKYAFSGVLGVTERDIRVLRFKTAEVFIGECDEFGDKKILLTYVSPINYSELPTEYVDLPYFSHRDVRPQAVGLRHQLRQILGV